MTKKKMDSYQWINTPPAENEIGLKDGAEFLPIGIVEPKLTKLDQHWGTENFKFQVFEIYGIVFVSASLELVVTYGGKTRRLSGSATLPIPTDTIFFRQEANTYYAPTLKSLSICNACKQIGPAFGQGLNERVPNNAKPTEEHKQMWKEYKKREGMFPEPDATIQEQYNKVVEDSNQGMMGLIRATYPNITYTGKMKITATNAESRMDK